MNGKYGGALLESSGRAIDAALTFRIKNQDAAMAQSEGAGAHGGNQVGIGIDDDHPQPACQTAHKPRTEDFAGADCKQVAEHGPGQNSSEHNRVKVALVIGRNDVRALPWKFLQPAHPQMKAVVGKNLKRFEPGVEDSASASRPGRASARTSGSVGSSCRTDFHPAGC